MTYNFKFSPYVEVLVHVLSTLFLLSVFALLCYLFLFTKTTKLRNKGFGEPMAYNEQLPEDVPMVHNMLHVSPLKKCLRVSEHVLGISGVNLEPGLTYLEYSIKVLDQKDRVT
jgi:hypothetical protein